MPKPIEKGATSPHHPTRSDIKPVLPSGRGQEHQASFKSSRAGMVNLAGSRCSRTTGPSSSDYWPCWHEHLACLRFVIRALEDSKVNLHKFRAYLSECTENYEGEKN